MPKPRAHSSVQKLGVEELVDNLLLSNATYKEIEEAVEQATGQKIGKSSLSRYRMRWEEERYREETITKEIDAMMRLLKAEPGLDPTDGAMLLIKRKLVSRLAQAEANFDNTDALDLAQVLIRMKRTEQMGGQLKVQEERLALLQQKVQATAEKVEAIGKAKHLDPETLKMIREEIYGLAPAAA
jgi:Protein of unknown function (DUF3486)